MEIHVKFAGKDINLWMEYVFKCQINLFLALIISVSAKDIISKIHAIPLLFPTVYYLKMEFIVICVQMVISFHEDSVSSLLNRMITTATCWH